MKKKGPTHARTAAESPITRIRREMSDAEIAHRAYEIYQSRGCEHGRDIDDWLRAERELMEQRSVFYGLPAKVKDAA